MYRLFILIKILTYIFYIKLASRKLPAKGQSIGSMLSIGLSWQRRDIDRSGIIRSEFPWRLEISIGSS